MNHRRPFPSRRSLGPHRSVCNVFPTCALRPATSPSALDLEVQPHSPACSFCGLRMFPQIFWASALSVPRREAFKGRACWGRQGEAGRGGKGRDGAGRAAAAGLLCLSGDWPAPVAGFHLQASRLRHAPRGRHALSGQGEEGANSLWRPVALCPTSHRPWPPRRTGSGGDHPRGSSACPWFGLSVGAFQRSDGSQLGDGLSSMIQL